MDFDAATAQRTHRGQEAPRIVANDQRFFGAAHCAFVLLRQSIRRQDVANMARPCPLVSPTVLYAGSKTAPERVKAQDTGYIFSARPRPMLLSWPILE